MKYQVHRPVVTTGWYFHKRHGAVYVIKRCTSEGIAVRKGVDGKQYGATFVVSRRELFLDRKVKV